MFGPFSHRSRQPDLATRIFPLSPSRFASALSASRMTSPRSSPRDGLAHAARPSSLTLQHTTIVRLYGTRLVSTLTLYDVAAPFEQRIFVVRGQKVMSDADLAGLYGVPTKVLNQAVKRNADRFPSDFMFQLNRAEVEESDRSQFVTGSQKHRDPLLPEPPSRRVGFGR